ncbi:glutamate--tRNA ligase [Actinocrinis puniceicyclus]|uniref:Glutamate--tRNA ligase n=1 Tax=Actinocrinis puniceicyclus TaxID=977794 RepID=A0A8J7WPQ1_9ACTN|nr:glutamate--tRNA ligase [Actinocrinis puniceicyclus]MBS2966376.1 glutamate--tRNA ligase [Actinocrinis puniceicyclus]
MRVRFPPSPTGDPHVGMVRSALFNYAFARHYGGTYVFRIEDTDAARNTEQSYHALIHTLRWMGLEWDEGPEAGGDYGPYRQSERGGIYADIAARLKAAGHAYDCYCTAEELEAGRERARAQKRTPGYEGTCRDLTPEQVAAHQAAGRSSVLRFRMPERQLNWNDLVRGEITFAPENVFDYVLVRADGSPLYTLVNPVDDALMRITHVLRGEDLLSSTPRQIPLHEALIELGLSERVPQFGHLPYVMGEGNKKLSKRDPEASFSYYLKRGFLPEGLLNYLALLGWSMGDDRELFTKQEMVAAFDGARISVNPARFDLKKCEAINAVHLRRLDPVDLAKRLLPFLADAGLLSGDAPDGHLANDAEWRLLLATIPLIQERMVVLSDALGMVGFLFAEEARFQVDPDDAAKVLTPEAKPVLEAAVAALAALTEWTTASIDEALRAALIEGLGLKPKAAFTAIRVAATGRRVSPPLFESLELLGRERTLARLRAAAETTA